MSNPKKIRLSGVKSFTASAGDDRRVIADQVWKAKHKIASDIGELLLKKGLISFVTDHDPGASQGETKVIVTGTVEFEAKRQ